jgi:hypothetical protein
VVKNLVKLSREEIDNVVQVTAKFREKKNIWYPGLRKEKYHRLEADQSINLR